MQRSPAQDRADRLIAMRASHDADLQRVLREEGLNLSQNGPSVDLQLTGVAADQRQRIEEAVERLSRDSGRSMDVYDRILIRAEREWEKDQVPLTQDAETKVRGQLQDATSALANGREDRFQAIQAEVSQDAAAMNDRYQARQQDIRDGLMASISEIDPTIARNEREMVAQTTAELRPVPKPVLELDQLPRQVEEAKVVHDRKMEAQQRPQSTPNPTSAPSR